MNQFRGFIGYNNTEIKTLWENAIFVVDTNILTNFYKYTSRESTRNLLDILKTLKGSNRLWIPHQVAIEYFFNYEENMPKQREGYEHLQQKLFSFKREVHNALETVKSAHPYINIENYQYFKDSLEESNQKLEKQIKDEIAQLPDSEEIKQDLLSLINGIIGNPYSQREIENIEKDGEERYKNLIPPGFSDAKIKGGQGNQDVRNYGGLKYHLAYGDLIVWKQIIDKAKETNQISSIIFITEDRKEDWWEKNKKKQIKRPHPLLIQEFINETQKDFYIYRTERFVELAKEYLGVNLTDAEVQSVSADVESIRRVEDYTESEYKDEELLDFVDINRVMEYLNSVDKNYIRRGLSRVKNGDYPYQNTYYNNIIRQAVADAYGYILNDFYVLFGKIEEYDPNLYNEVGDEFYNLPEPLEYRVDTLFKYIDLMNNSIEYYQEKQDKGDYLTNEIRDRRKL